MLLPAAELLHAYGVTGVPETSSVVIETVTPVYESGVRVWLLVQAVPVAQYAAPAPLASLVFHMLFVS